MGANGVTLSDVSARAGVSRSTASLVVRGSGRISNETRDRVLLAMEELGYVYNRQAANMRQRQSFTIGLVVTDIHDPFLAELVMSIEDAAHANDYQLFVGYSREDAERQQEILVTMTQRQVDGLFLVPAIKTDVEAIERLIGLSRIPTVQLVRSVSTEFDYCGTFNVLAGERLARHLASLGVRSAVLVGGAESASDRIERLEGLQSGFRGTQVHMDLAEAVATENSADAGARGVAEVLDRGELPDAIIAHSDVVASGIYAELQRRELMPGRDIAVASFDDNPSAALQLPPLTSVATHPERLAEQASALLLTRIGLPAGGTRPTRLNVEPALRVRGSTAQWRPRESRR